MPRPARRTCPSTSCPPRPRPTRSTTKPTAKFDQGTKDGVTGDNFVQITVFLAAVLFLVGIGSSFRLHGVRYALITFGSVLLIFAIVLILQQPGLPS